MAQPDIAELYHKFVGKKALLTVLDAKESKRKSTNAKGEEIEVDVEASLGIKIPVRIINVRMSYGRVNVLIRPHRGLWETWVQDSDRLTILEDRDDWPEEKDLTVRQ